VTGPRSPLLPAAPIPTALPLLLPLPGTPGAWPAAASPGGGRPADSRPKPGSSAPGPLEWPSRGPVRRGGGRPGRPAADRPRAGAAYTGTLIRRTQHTDSLEEQ
jgi:hypothetical protein